jgi:DNA polymerase
MDPRRLSYLHALDIDVWEPRDATPASVAEPAAVTHTIVPRELSTVAQPPPTSKAPVVTGSPAVRLPDLSGMDWDALSQTVRSCTLCDLHKTRTQAVFGVGNRAAQWMVIGEAPGADEDRQGEPFVGRAGQLLNAMLKAMGLAREQVYIANILKSRPPNNRDPRGEEVRACLPYLYRQIELINPRLILCVGRIAAQTLLKTDTTIGKLRGKLHELAPGRPMIVTYHPAYLLRSPAEKRKAWADLVLAMQTFEKLGGAQA